MASSSSMSIVFLFLSVALLSGPHTQVTANVDPLLPLCKTVCGGDQYVGIQFCMDALHSDPRSNSTEGTNEFVAIGVAVDLLTANATSTKSKIDGLLRGWTEDRNATTPCLLACQALYEGILGFQPACAADVKAGKLAEANVSLDKTTEAVKECESWSGQNNVTSPLTVENDNAFKLAKLAVALIESIPPPSA